MGSLAGNRKYLVFDLGLDEIAHRIEPKMRDVGQFVRRNHAADNRRAIDLVGVVVGDSTCNT
jgi:hypothetical protein